MRSDHHIRYPTTGKIGLAPLQCFIIDRIHHIGLALCRLIATFYPIAVFALHRGSRQMVSAHQAVEPTTRTGCDSLWNIHHSHALGMQLLQQLQGVLPSAHAHHQLGPYGSGSESCGQIPFGQQHHMASTLLQTLRHGIHDGLVFFHRIGRKFRCPVYAPNLFHAVIAFRVREKPQPWQCQRHGRCQALC